MRIALVAAGGFDRSGRERIIPSLLWLVERLARRHEVFVYVLRYHHKPCRYRLAGATIHDLGCPEGWWRQYAGAVFRHPRRWTLRCHSRLLGSSCRIDCDRRRPAAGCCRSSSRATAVSSLPFPGLTTVSNRDAAPASQSVSSLDSPRGSPSAAGTQARHARAHDISPQTIPLGVDTSLFTERLAVPPGSPFRLLHVASLNPVKDQATLLRAIRHLAAADLDVTLDIVGEDTMGGSLTALARDLQLADRVTFHGFRSSEQLVPLLHQSDLFVLSSLHEAAGVVLLEAASCGVPVVGSAVGYLADWAPDAATAVAPGDPAALATAIHGLLMDEPRRRQTAINAAAWARTHDADWSARAFEGLYAEIARARHPSE